MSSVATRHRTGSAAYESDAERWAAVAGRDRRANGIFYYSVRTTGVYCRPACAARLARRENVRFHATCGDAERAGFRPCKRCRPDGHGLDAARAEAVARACRLIEWSSSGIRIMVDAPRDVADRFSLLLSRDAAPGRRCRVKWRSGSEIGAEFVGATR